MPLYYRDHDLLLITSLFEGCPLALLEAMAAAMPIVASSVGGIPDVLEHGKEGLLFTSMNITEATEQLCRLMANPLLAYQLGAEAQKRARTLAWQSTASVLVNAIQHR
jgi:glycosyltransferase involved in cell wall biosynthesis